MFANTTPTLHQHPTQWVSVSAVASILACWSVSTCRWGVGGVLVGCWWGVRTTPHLRNPQCIRVFQEMLVRWWVFYCKTFFFLHYLTPKSYYDILSERVVQTWTLPVIKSGFTPTKVPLYTAVSPSPLSTKMKKRPLHHAEAPSLNLVYLSI